jgi:short-subunit dehydrogenase
MSALRKTIVITGASSGLGRGMAREFARLGRDLALCARRLDRLEELRAELQEAHPSIRVVVRTLDVTSHEDVFETFRAFRRDLGRIDRVVVNAGLGKGQPIGTGGFAANRQTVETNLVAALAQCEAAIEIFRAQNAGHLVVIASLAAVRGMRGSATAYAASKAGLVSLAEGIRADLLPTPIRVTTVLPGYIRSEMNDRLGRPLPFLVDTETGSRALVRAIEREPAVACVPPWPWAVIAFLLRRLPISVVARMS